MVILDVGNGAEHLVHLMGLDELFHIVERSLIDGRGRSCLVVVVKESHNVVTVTHIGQHLVDEAHTHGAASNDDDALEVEAPVAVQFDELS